MEFSWGWRAWTTTTPTASGVLINPWATHSRFIIRQALVRDEAHHAAPAKLIVLARLSLYGHGAARRHQLREALDRAVDQRREDAAGKLGKRAEEEAARFARVLEEQRLATIDADLEREPERIRRTVAPNPNSSAKPRGILTPRLFLYFCTFVSTTNQGL